MTEQKALVDMLEESKEVLQEWLGARKPLIGLILGSGLNHFADHLAESTTLSFRDVPFMNMSTAEGHVGQFVCGTIGEKVVLCMQGRLHGYEGNNAQEVAYPVWLMQQVGVDTLITTNAAGAINESYAVGDFCVMRDQINFTARNPIAVLQAADLNERFFSMTDAFDPHLRSIAISVAKREDVGIQEGVYLGLLGPSFETPAEIRMFRNWGADTVAMSVVEEVIAARHGGMRVLGISLVSNMAAGIGGSSPDGAEVMEIARNREDDFIRLMTGILKEI